MIAEIKGIFIITGAVNLYACSCMKYLSPTHLVVILFVHVFLPIVNIADLGNNKFEALYGLHLFVLLSGFNLTSVSLLQLKESPL